MKNILDLTYEDLYLAVIADGEKKFRAAQIFDWIYKKRIYDFDSMNNIPAGTKRSLKNNYYLMLPEILERKESKKDDSIRYMIGLDDGSTIEALLMKYRYGYSICISSQVGCRMGCAFCASADLGFIRNLTPGEFTGQVLTVEKNEHVKISHIAVMGIGEPLDNFDNLMDFIDIANDSAGLNMSARNITVSTCGIVDRIRDIADRDIKINLALSVHSANNEKRLSIMPVTNRFGTDAAIDAMKYHFRKTGRRPTYEYTLIKKFNDSPKDAAELAEKIKGTPAHVNLIFLNETGRNGYRRSDRTAALEFSNVLNKNGIEVTIRRRTGADIDAACGQLKRDRGAE